MALNKSDYSSSIENVDEVTKKIKVTIPGSFISKEYKDALNTLSRSVAIKGFRAGKAPMQMVEKVHGDRAKMDVAQRLVNSSLSDVVKEEKLEIVGSPEIDITTYEMDKGMEYVASVSLFPTPEVKGYESFKVKVQKREVADKDVDEVIEKVRASKATMKKIELRTAAKAGDVVDLTVSVEVEGEKTDRPEPLVIGLGENKLPKELEEGIIGMEIGTQKDIEAQGAAPQGGKPKKTIYKVTLNALFEKLLPELTDDFAKGSDIGAETVLEMRMKIRKELEEQKARESKSDAQVAVLDVLVKENEFKVPQLLLDDEIRGLLVRAGIMDNKKAENADLEPFRKELGEIAMKRVRSSIIIDRIGEALKIKAEKEDIEKEITQLAARSGVGVEDARRFVMDQSRVVGFVMEISRNKVIDTLLSRTQIEYVENLDSAKAA